MLVISHKYKYIFIHIPKNAGNSVSDLLLRQEDYAQTKIFLRKLLMKMGARDVAPYFYRVKDQSRWRSSASGLSVFSMHAPALLIRDLLPPRIFNTYHKVAVVRNPWDRCVSLFRYHQYTPAVREMSFMEYLKERQGNLEQAKFIVDESGNLLVDSVLRFEQLQSDLEALFATCNIKDGAIDLGHINPSKRESDFKKYYSDNETIEFVSSTVERDLKLFGYEY